MTPDTVFTGLFFMFTAIAIGSSLIVAFSRNLAHSIFMLLISLGSVASFYALFGADFLFAVQVLIYVGGILVILIFAMFISEKFPIEKEDVDVNKAVSAMIVGIIFFITMAMVAFGTNWPTPTPESLSPTTAQIGTELLQSYLLPFELIGVVLLAALIGATMLTRSKEEQDPHTKIAYEPERDDK